MKPPLLESLTPRELEVLTMIAEGKTLAQIAETISRSTKTVESHRLSIGRKLHASNRVELARIAIAAGLVAIDPAADTPAAQTKLEWLDEINQAVSDVAGHDYIRALCDALTRVLGVRFAAVCISTEPNQTDRFVVAMSEDGESLHSIQYNMAPTPVPQALTQGVVRVPDQLDTLYPDDPFVKAKQLKSYLGIRLEADLGNKIGVYSIMHDQPLDHPESVEWLMRFFLARTSLELERLHHTQVIEQLQRQLNHQGPGPNQSNASVA